MVGDGQRIAVASIAELELALEVRAPQIIGAGACGQRRAARAMARHAATLDQTVTVENRMDGAFGGNLEIAIEPPDQPLADRRSRHARSMTSVPQRSTPITRPKQGLTPSRIRSSAKIRRGLKSTCSRSRQGQAVGQGAGGKLSDA
jgi:hypothetical protein